MRSIPDMTVRCATAPDDCPQLKSVKIQPAKGLPQRYSYDIVIVANVDKDERLPKLPGPLESCRAIMLSAREGDGPTVKPFTIEPDLAGDLSLWGVTTVGDDHLEEPLVDDASARLTRAKMTASEGKAAVEYTVRVTGRRDIASLLVGSLGADIRIDWSPEDPRQVDLFPGEPGSDSNVAEA